MLRAIRPLFASISRSKRGHASGLRHGPRSLLLFALALSLSACRDRQTKGTRSTPAPSKPAPQPPKINKRAIDLFAFGRQLGAIAPCGCTADPLGGLQYAFGYINEHSTPTKRAILQGGSFLFPDPKGPNAAKNEAEWGQINERAKLLTKSFGAFGPQLHLGVGPTDYSSPQGAKALATYASPRVSANLPATAPLSFKPWQTMKLGPGITAAVTHVVDPALQAEAGAMPKIADPSQALSALLPEMKADQPDLLVLTIQARRPFAEALLAKVPGFDLAVVTGPIDDLDKARLGGSPGKIGETWLVEPGDQAQTISHLRLVLPDAIWSKAKDAPNQDLIPPASQWALLSSKEEQQKEAARLQKRLATFEKDPSADPQFLARMRADLKKLQTPAAAPKDRIALQIEAAKVSCHGEASKEISQALANYDQWVAKANKTRFTGVFAPKPEAGKPHYVGDKTCRNCHAKAFEFWQKTHHAAAFATLEKANKEYDLNCVGCHVTGYRQPGGSELVENKGLRDVQCEQCHGPGSAHAKSANTKLISRKVPESTCKGCHTPEHSDTFQYEAYLRDILGPGHGDAARKALGNGPTGHALRQAALAKAGGSCK